LEQHRPRGAAPGRQDLPDCHDIPRRAPGSLCPGRAQRSAPRKPVQKSAWNQNFRSEERVKGLAGSARLWRQTRGAVISVETWKWRESKVRPIPENSPPAQPVSLGVCSFRRVGVDLFSATPLTQLERTILGVRGCSNNNRPRLFRAGRAKVSVQWPDAAQSTVRPG
jgi:hypothetical protein